jgi:hypothetical protein
MIYKIKQYIKICAEVFDNLAVWYKVSVAKQYSQLTWKPLCVAMAMQILLKVLYDWICWTELTFICHHTIILQ